MTRPSETVFCFFDLDGTLIQRDSYLPFLFGWLSQHPNRIFFILTLPLYYCYYLIARKKRAFIKEKFLTAFMRNADKLDIDNYVQSFWKKFLPKQKNEAAMKKLIWHHDQGHHIFVVTASFEFYANYLIKLLPVEGIIATKEEWQNNKLTGNLLGKNCKGHEKVTRIESLLGVKLNNLNYYAYSDSDCDAPLLQGAKYAYKVDAGTIAPWKQN